jgi:NADH-quinone oxidoreductase subunit N
MGAFLVTEITRRNEKSEDLIADNGLSRRSPLLALSMLLFLLSLGGIPFVMGFWAKIYIFTAAARAGLLALVILGAIVTVLALFYYLNIARKMYIEAPQKEEPISIPLSLSIVIVISALAVAVFGLIPGTIAGPAIKAASAFMAR